MANTQTGCCRRIAPSRKLSLCGVIDSALAPTPTPYLANLQHPQHSPLTTTTTAAAAAAAAALSALKTAAGNMCDLSLLIL
ncbi:hypothetical protein ElyMa_001321600 [Elysia marginata]|uniref:Uncharacterized protein n=1 Tax=Elysia marginata TaxID=1093978 RepID=A0AAV4IL61_9GAST|nr:hypothetical protein ElyMa_001321600 [Elysia marginata]